MTREESLKQLGELNPDALLPDGYQDAYLGYTTVHPYRAIYDRDKCLSCLMQQGMDFDTAEEFFAFNTECAYVGDNAPLYIEVVQYTEGD